MKDLYHAIDALNEITQAERDAMRAQADAEAAAVRAAADAERDAVMKAAGRAPITKADMVSLRSSKPTELEITPS